MIIGLHDADAEHLKHKTFPNYALMKISAYHKALGDTVEWWNGLFTGRYDKVYSSKIFDFTEDNPYLPADTVRGGTGYRDIPISQTLPPEIDAAYPDYSIYPKCDYAIGYLTRGCPNHCRWCVVPDKEGDIRPYRKWQEVIRPDTNKLVLMDNNILASDYGIGELERLTKTEYRVDLNQGMDARLVDKRVADILSRLKWISYIRFSCDQKSQIEAIFNAAALLKAVGVKPSKLFIYLLVTADVDDAAYRVEKLKTLRGISFYAQSERNSGKGIVPGAEQQEFAHRYIFGHCYKKETWPEYQKRHSELKTQTLTQIFEPMKGAI